MMEVEDTNILDKILSRSVTIVHFIHLISYGKDYNELF